MVVGGKIMDKNIKKDWVNALRSGRYEQGRGSLCNDHRFCCLGVLYEVLIKEGHFSIERTCRGTLVMYDGNISYPYNLINCNIIRESDVDKLVIMNDSKGFSFKEIADWIEENL